MDELFVAVTGATGSVGGRVAQQLADAGVRQRLVVRDLSRAPALPRAEARRASSYGAFDEMRAALDGAGVAFLIPATEAEDRVEQHKTAIDAVVAAGVARVVYLSQISAAPDATFTLARDHWHTEQHIRASGLAWTFLRMNLYLDSIPAMVTAEGVIRGPASDGQLSAVLRGDVAASVTAVLTSKDHDGREFALTGSESFTLAEAAATMSQASAKAISFIDETDDEASTSRRALGASDYEVAGWTSSYQAIRNGDLAAVTQDVRDLTGHDPVTLSAYLDANPGALDHVA